MRRPSFVVLAALSLLAGCATATDDSPLDWDEFQAQAYREPDTGIYVVNGDEPAADEGELAELYRRYLDSQRLADGVGVAREPSIVNRVNGVDDRWSASQAMSLTFCVARKSFGSRYDAAVAAMDQAAAAWEGVARVHFVHASSVDGNCTARSGVVFDVRQVCTGQYLARAFFPSTARRGRELLIDCTAFGAIPPWTLAGVLRHELGHALGLRHEHTRPEAGTCFEDSSWRALTAYDAASVMHYPQCNGANQGDLVLTDLDRAGIAQLYP
jgi:hypothetical protein